MFTVYVMKSLSHSTRYVGTTKDVKKRLREHNLGKCRYTKGRKPWSIIYTEIYETRGETMKREKFLKSGQGRKFLNNVASTVPGSYNGSTHPSGG